MNQPLGEYPDDNLAAVPRGFVTSKQTVTGKQLVELATNILARHATSDGLTNKQALVRFQFLFIEPRTFAPSDDPFLQLVVKAEDVIHRNSTGGLSDAQAMAELYTIFDGS